MRTKNQIRFDYSLLVVATMIHAGILFLLSNYSKAITVYYDELLLYDAAKSLSTGVPITVHGVCVGFKNCLYPILILPAFLARNTIFRAWLIMVINSIIISCSMVISFAICRELKVRRIYCWIVAILIGVWPDMSFSMTYMSENAYFPFFLLAMLFIVRMFKSRTITSAIVAGFCSYLVCFCKEVGFCIPVAVVFTEFLVGTFDVIHSKNKRTTLKQRVINIAIYSVVFLILHFLVKESFRNSATRVLYQGIVTKAMELIKDPYKMAYSIYLVVYYLVASMIAFFVFPIVLLVKYSSRMNKINKTVSLFCASLLMTFVMVIIVDNGVRENLGAIIPRVHLRYIFPMIGLFLPLTFSYFSNDCDDNKRLTEEISKMVTPILVLFLFIIMVFRGVPFGNVVDSAAISLFTAARKLIPDITGNSPDSIVFCPGAVVAIICLLCSYLVGIILAKRFSLRIMLYYFSVMALLLSILNFGLSYLKYRSVYSVDAEMIRGMTEINDYLIKIDDSANVMYIGDKYYVASTRVFDQYLDVSGEEFSLDYGMSTEMMQNDEHSIDVTDYTFEDTIKKDKYYVDSIDYIITSDPEYVDSNIDGVERITDIGVNYYALYRNNNPLTIESKINDGNMLIQLAKSGNNASNFISKGISSCEGDFTWTDGDEFVVDFDEFDFKDTENVHVIIDVHDTFNGNQKYIIFQNDEYVDNGNIDGRGEIEFSLPYAPDKKSFSVHLPDAVSPQSIGESLDERKLSLALKKIIIEAE